MIPLRDENRSRSFPYVLFLIIAINLGVFAYQAFFGVRNFDDYVLAYGLVPIELTQQLGLSTFPDLFSAMFMHGSIMHLLSNMWFLWVFGDNIEDELGHGRFLVFYLTVGVIATLAHVAIDPSSRLPLVGASGAIAGVLGGYFILFPFHRILTLIPVFIFFTTARIPAMVFLGLWFLMQVLYSAAGGNVAWWAHIGGFVSGIFLVFLFRRR